MEDDDDERLMSDEKMGLSGMSSEEREAYENRLQAWRQAMIQKYVNQNWIISVEDSSSEPEKPKRSIEAIEELEYDMLRWEIMEGKNGSTD